MVPTGCRVESVSRGKTAASPGTIAVERAGTGEGLVVRTTGEDLIVAAILSREEALTFLLAAADALGLVLLDPRDAARRRAASLKRRRER